MDPSDVVEETRRGNSRPPVIANILQQPAFLYLFQTDLKQLQVIFPGHRPFCFRITAMNRIGFRGWSRNWLQLVAGGRLCVMVACRLLLVPGQQAIRPLVSHGTVILSRRHQFDDKATCVATLAGHSSNHVFFSKTTVFIIFSILTNCFASLRNWCVHIIFTLSKPCSNNGTTKVWRMSADGNAATCDATCVE